MRVVFFGTPEFAVPSLAALLDHGIDVAAAVVQPDRPTSRSHSTLTAPPVKRHAERHGIAVWQPERPRGDVFVDQLRATAPDLGVVVAYGHLLRPEVLAIPRLGFVNVHASLLPRWRGAAPIQWALLSGDNRTGVSIMRVEPALDSGPVWHVRHTPISASDTSGTLVARMADLGAEALLETLPRIAAGESPVTQSADGVTVAPKIDRAVARIRWDQPAADVSCRIRAMDPAPGAWTVLGSTEFKFFGAAAGPSAARAPGAIFTDAMGMMVATADSAVRVTEVQPAGKRRMPALDWLRGAGLAPDAYFA